MKTKRKSSNFHEELEQRAAEAGLSISEFFQEEYRKAHPPRPIAEVLADIKRLPKVELDKSSAEIVREMRGPLPLGD